MLQALLSYMNIDRGDRGLSCRQTRLGEEHVISIRSSGPARGDTVTNDTTELKRERDERRWLYTLGMLC